MTGDLGGDEARQLLVVCGLLFAAVGLCAVILGVFL